MESRATRGAVAAVVRRRRFAGGDVDHPSLVVEQTLSRRVITVVAALVATVALAHMAVVESAEGDGQCALTQNCHSYVLDSPCHAIPSDKKPTKMNFTAPACPEYADNACCNAYQNQYLTFNFMLIDAAFGSADAGGCPACAANVKKLWCDFTCAPNQADFVEVLGLRNMTDPANPPVVTEVLWAKINFDKKTACDMYDSCRDTTKARQVQTLKSCNGFLDYQGKYEAIGRGNFLQFEFAGSTDRAEVDAITEAEGWWVDEWDYDYSDPSPFKSALTFPIHDCSNYTLPGQTTPHSCPCGSCRQSCAASSNSTDLSTIRKDAAIHPLNGADWPMIGIVYAVIAVFSVGILMYRASK